MELAEKIETINQSLIDLFGIDTITGDPIWRVVWSNDQLEKRKTDISPSGIQLLRPEVMELPKYYYARDKYILERLVIVPEINIDELPCNKTSYEPMWVFQDSFGNYLPPTLVACKFVVDCVYAAMGKTNLAKYKDPDTDGHAEDRRQQRVQELENELFGDESGLKGKTIYGEGVVVPENYQKKES